MKNELKDNKANQKISRREQVLIEASEFILGLSQKANNKNPYQRTQEVVKLLDSLRDKEKYSVNT